MELVPFDRLLASEDSPLVELVELVELVGPVELVKLVEPVELVELVGGLLTAVEIVLPAL